ncbi:dTMP kinase [Caldibacillus debilis]|jgi:dTMP kinase|uniref:Thymidylate kinase n=1 Tax=Caldibacillus debilis GB1 TaxID=1339248 RepID=A0A420VI09_9BACI|nr:dTMP kinase [Caldibacillus debilis]RKO63302.1 thymidylate kinase [Caldibacillus debilis GB1]
MKNGRLITFEGPEGAGKTTILKMVAGKLREMGYPVVETREPGGIPIAEKIREIILNPEHKEMDAKTEALLYAAARRQHLVEKIMPALDGGAVVLCDRFIDASLAYQGYARGIGIEAVLMINRFAVEQTMPDLTLYFDVEPETGLERIRKNFREEVNRLDMENLSFHRLVREGYLLLADTYPDRIRKIDAHRTVEAVYSDALRTVCAYLERHWKKTGTSESL